MQEKIASNLSFGEGGISPRNLLPNNSACAVDFYLYDIPVFRTQEKQQQNGGTSDSSSEICFATFVKCYYQPQQIVD